MAFLATASGFTIPNVLSMDMALSAAFRVVCGYFLKTLAMVLPSSAGVAAMAMPASRSAAIFSAAPSPCRR